MMKQRGAYRRFLMSRAGVWCLGSIILLQQLVWTTHAHSSGTTKLQKRLPRGARLLHPSDRTLPQRNALPPQRDLGGYPKYYEDDYYYANSPPDSDKTGKMGSSSKKSKGRTYPTKPSDEETEGSVSSYSTKSSSGKEKTKASDSMKMGSMKSSGEKEKTEGSGTLDSMKMGNMSKGRTYPNKPSYKYEETEGSVTGDSMKSSGGKGKKGGSTTSGIMKSSGGKTGKGKSQKSDDYYYDDHYYDDDYKGDEEDDGHDTQTCIAVYTNTESCCVCQCCHNLGPAYPDGPSYPLAPGKGSTGSSKGQSMGTGKKEEHGRHLSGYPPDEYDSRCYCTCDEDCAVPTPPPQVVHTPPPYSTPAPQTPPSYPPPTMPTPKKSSKSKKEKGSSKEASKKSKSTKTKSTKETTPRSSEGDEISEKSGTGTDASPPNEQSYSRRNFKFPWLLLLIVGACGSLYTLHLLNRRRRLQNHDDTATRMSWSV